MFCEIIVHNIIFLLSVDDGSGPDKIAHIMGPPDRCEHAASIINDLLQSIRVREEGGGVSDAHIILNIYPIHLTSELFFFLSQIQFCKFSLI